MKLLAALVVAEAAAVTVFAFSDTVQAASIAAVASVVNTLLIVHGQRQARSERAHLHRDLRQVRRATQGRRRATRGKDDEVLLIEVPEGLDLEQRDEEAPR